MRVLLRVDTVGRGGIWLLTLPTFTALAADKVRTTPLLRMSKLVKSIAPHYFGNVWVNRNPLITDMEVCKQTALRMSEGWHAEGRVCCPFSQLICSPATQTDQQGQTESLRPTHHLVNEYEWLPEESLWSSDFPCARDVIQEESRSREPLLVFYSVPQRRDMRLWSLRQQHYPTPLYTKRTGVPHGLVRSLQMEKFEACSRQIHRDSTPRRNTSEVGNVRQT